MDIVARLITLCCNGLKIIGVEKLIILDHCAIILFSIPASTKILIKLSSGKILRMNDP